jgi:hypothetical protein
VVLEGANKKRRRERLEAHYYGSELYPGNMKREEGFSLRRSWERSFEPE